METTSHSELPLDDERMETWHCSLHGTVSRCPFRFLRCDVLPLAQDAAPPSGRGWLAQETTTKSSYKEY